MSSSFPTSIDSFSNPAGTDVTGLTTGQSTVTHSTQHANANDAIEALEAKVGVNSSAVTTSLDYKLTNTSSSNPGHKHTLTNGATDVTATATELNYFSGFQKIFKTTTETVNNSTTLQNDDELIIPVTANQVYGFNGEIRFFSGTTPDINLGWSVPSGTTMSWNIDDFDQTELTESSTYFANGNGPNSSNFTIHGIIYSGSTSGNVILQWAQHTMDASDTKIYRGSFLLVTKLT